MAFTGLLSFLARFSFSASGDKYSLRNPARHHTINVMHNINTTQKQKKII